MSADTATSTRSTVKRNARRAEYDRQTLLDILRAQQLCHVAYVEDGQPRQIPTLYFVDDDYLYLHGNRSSALLRYMSHGGEVCITATLVNGVVGAPSGFHCSMNYRSVTLFGRGEVVVDAQHEQMLAEFVRVLVPGHQEAVRAPTRQELAATAVVRISLDEMSGKVRGGGPIDDPADIGADVWAGVIPVGMATGQPQPSADLPDKVAMPDYIEQFDYRG